MNFLRFTLTIIVVFTVNIFAGSVCSGDDDSNNKVWLSSLDLTKACTAGHGVVRARLNTFNSPIMINGRKFEEGIGVCAHSIIYVDIKKSGKMFDSFIGVEDVSKDDVAVKFRILGDLRELFDSGLIYKGEPARHISVSIEDVNQLALIVMYYGKTFHNHFADWADACFIMSGQDKPEIISLPEEPAERRTPQAPAEPRINGPRIYGVRPGSDFIYRIPTTGQRPMKFSAGGLPEGLRLDENSGIISGKIKKAGKYNVTLTAENEKGKAAAEFRIQAGQQLALTPPMGWNSWYMYGMRIDEKKMRDATDFMIKSGMADNGYSYVNIDDGWMIKPALDEPLVYKGVENVSAVRKLALKRHLKPSSDYKTVPAVRDVNGNILPRAEFANMNGLTDYIHSKGLKAGLYSSPGPLTCGCGIGSFGYEAQDADTYAKWGFDFLKYDWCSYGYIRNDNNLPVQQHIDTFKLMGDALRKQDRDVVFNFCQYGIADVWKWGHKAGGHSWRVDSDLGSRIENHAIYCNLLGIASGMAAITDYQMPGRWNDPDYIMIGDRWHLSPGEKYSYMTFWAIWASPLFYSADIANLDDFTLNILCNPEIIAVNQDILGLQGKRIIMEDDYQVWVKPLDDKSLAVALFNTGESDMRIKLTWSELGLKGKQKIRDLWRQNDIGVLDTAFEMKVSRHSAEMVRFIGSGRD